MSTQVQYSMQTCYQPLLLYASLVLCKNTLAFTPLPCGSGPILFILIIINVYLSSLDLNLTRNSNPHQILVQLYYKMD